MSVEQLDALLAPDGQALLERLGREDTSATHSLRLGATLRTRFPAELVATALSQQELRRAAAAKFRRAGQMYFTRPGLEQASAEMISRHRARRFAGCGRLADLCTGIGGDLIALAGRAEQAETLAVDLDEVHLRMALLNAEVYGVTAGVRTVCADVRTVDVAGLEGVFVDPARRLGGRRLRTGRSEPPLPWCLALADAVPAVGIKLAPGLDRDTVPAGWELEFLADRRELKEAFAWSPELATATRRATVLPGGHTLTAGAGAPVPVGPPGEFLLDPNPAVTRAGVVEDLARLTGCWKIDDQIAFLSADRPVRTPFARTLRVLESAPWQEKLLPARLRALDIGSVDIRRRGLAGDIEGLHRRLKLTGSRRATLVMTRMRDKPWSLICLDDTTGTG
ncbi:MAG TPA: class I SAM-dependent methyltransferase [Pseudonocardiaceae bacterium]|nr:class I SAM-dependent methyltransferase [Pseudonocardiaceae bacterium]